ncbi:DUF6233 domain-containing protein [Streptomyces erythrochromogenes]|uniref:DUF6233 domain-containing protein n=1 Tax=Streptomyces erythrochromogenes TaxID=285574 RepID=UPI0036FEFBE0
MYPEAQNRHGPAPAPPPHRGCWDTGRRCVPTAAEQVRRLLGEGVPACVHCRPGTALGVLD